MEQFLEDTSSIYYWLRVFIVGIIVSIIANYLPSIIGKLFGKFSSSIRKWSQKAKEEEERRVIKMTNDPEYFLHSKLNVITMAIFSTQVLIMSLFLGTIILVISGLFQFAETLIEPMEIQLKIIVGVLAFVVVVSLLAFFKTMYQIMRIMYAELVAIKRRKKEQLTETPETPET